MKRRDYFETSGFIIAAIIIAGALFFAIVKGIFTDEDTAIRTLEAQGYSNIQIVDKAWFAVGFRGCDEKDAARFTAKVTNPAGKSSEVYVCTGAFFKGGTVRGK